MNKEVLPFLRNYIKQTGKQWNYITPCEFYDKFFSKKEKNYVLIDLRRKSDYAKFHVPGSVNIFWLDLLKQRNLDRLNKYLEKG